MSHFNHQQIKRAAHRLGRNDSSWNPFGHTWGAKPAGSRRETWNGGALEAQGGIDTTSPISQTRTAPDRFVNQSDEDDRGFTKNVEGRNGNVSSQQDSGETSIGSQSTTAGNALDKSETGLTRRTTKRDNGSINGDNRGVEALADDDKKGKKPKKDSRFLKHIEPKEPFTVGNQLRRTFLNSWINVLILAAPIGIALNYVPGINKIVVFVVNFIAIIPLAAMLSFATEEIALRTGETLGGLLNATFGNAVELIIAIIALMKGEVEIVQTSLVGSILSNLLLVMGMCFFFGGLRREKQYFNTVVAQTAASLLALAVASVIVPTVFDVQTSVGQDDIAKLSRGTAVILLIVYIAYLYFQLHTHHSVFSSESEKVPMRPNKHALKDGAIAQGLAKPAALMGAHGLSSKDDNEKLRETLRTPLQSDDEEEEDPQLHFWVAIAALAASTVVIALCAEFMVDGIDAVTTQGGLKKEFVGLILLPIVGNAAEHATAVTVAIKDKMDLAIGVAIGSSMQVALFLIPLLVIIGWGMHNDEMSLSFDVFQVAVLFVAVLLVNYLIADGQSHWLEGMLLMCLYAIIGTCAFFYKVDGDHESSGPDSSNNGIATSR